MKKAEIVRLNRDFLKKMSECGIRTEDYKYAEVIDTYEDMLKHGDKVTYIVSKLSHRYNLSERSVYRLISDFNRDVMS